MKRHLLPVFCILLLSGCAGTSSSTSPPVKPPKQTTVQYKCENGELVEVRFFPDQGVGVLVRDGKTMELQQQPAASGFLYRNGTGSHTLRGKGDELHIEIGRRVPLRCQAVE